MEEHKGGARRRIAVVGDVARLAVNGRQCGAERPAAVVIVLRGTA